MRRRDKEEERSAGRGQARKEVIGEKQEEAIKQSETLDRTREITTDTSGEQNKTFRSYEMCNRIVNIFSFCCRLGPLLIFFTTKHFKLL